MVKGLESPLTSGDWAGKPGSSLSYGDKTGHYKKCRSNKGNASHLI